MNKSITFSALAFFLLSICLLFQYMNRKGESLNNITQQYIYVHHQNDEICMEKAGLVIQSSSRMGKTTVSVYDQSIELPIGQKSIKKVVRIDPQLDEQLNAKLVFSYKEIDLKGIPEENLILYSSSDNGKTWNPHPDSKVDLVNNSIHLDDLEHFSLWTAGSNLATANIASTATVADQLKIAFVHGSDATSSSGVGISAWTLKTDSTFSRSEISFAGFDRDGTGSEVFGHSNTSQTFFVDVNNDVFVDVVHVTENNNNSIHVWLNNGDNSFQTTALETSGFQNASNGIFAGLNGSEQGWMADMDNDGNVDYVFSGNDDQVHVYMGIGDGTFNTTKISTSLTGTSDKNSSGIDSDQVFFLKDVNDDDFPDLVAAVETGCGFLCSTQKLQVWLGNGDGTFVTTTHFDATIDDTGSTNSIGSADNEFSELNDINGDGFPDYIHVEIDGDNQIWIYLNNGDGTYNTTPTNTILVDPPAGENRLANFTNAELSFLFDINDDGFADYISSNDNSGDDSGMSVYFSNGDGTFNPNPVNTFIPREFGVGVSDLHTTMIVKDMIYTPEICGNGIDDDGDGLVDCYDTWCVGDLACDPAPAPVACDQSVAFIHGSDTDGPTDLGLSIWISNDDGSFDPEQLAYAGFNRDGIGTDMFGADVFSNSYFGDVNNDSYPDIVHVTEDSNNSIFVYLSNGDNTFAYEAITTTGFQDATSSKFAGESGSEQGWLVDVTGDNRLDYVFSGNDGYVHTYIGLGDGIFETTRITTILQDINSFYNSSGTSSSEYFTLVDVTGDNVGDLIGTFDDLGSGRLQIWKGLGDGRFDPNYFLNILLEDSGSSNSSGRGNEEYSDFADVDGDGDIDYVHANAMDGDIEIWSWFNDGAGNFNGLADAKTISMTAPPAGSGYFANYTAGEQSFFADVNKDNIIDYLATNDNSGTNSGISVYLGIGDGIFTTNPENTLITDKFGTGINNVELTGLVCGVFVRPEICTNCMDDNGNGDVDGDDAFCANSPTANASATVPSFNGSVAFIHGNDGGGYDGLAIWLSNNDGTFSNSKNSITGFDRDNVGTETFGFSGTESTHFSDIDNDGDVDLIHTTEDNGNSIYTYLNNGDNSFNTTAVTTIGITAGTDGTVFSGYTASEQGWIKDVNGDFYPDYVFSGNDGQVHTYIGNGDGTFRKNRITSLLSNTSAFKTSGISGSEQFFLEDLNRDNVADLVGTFDDSGTGRMQAWLGYGDGRFNTALYFDITIEDTGTSNSSGAGDEEFSAFSDINNDGYLDYIHANAMDGDVEIWSYLNDQTGNISATAIKSNVTAPSVGSTKFANYKLSEQSFLADVNKDNRIDYVTSYDNEGSNSGITVYLGVGDGTFATTPITTTIADFGTGSNAGEISAIIGGLFFDTGESPSTTAAPDLCCASGIVAPPVSKTDTLVACPDTDFDLTPLHIGAVPAGATLVWSRDNDPGNGLSSTTAMPVSMATVYYAYYYDSAGDCYSPPSVGVQLSFDCIEIDSDGDGDPDTTDPDDDNDGIADVAETGDTDNDGIPDSLESNVLDTDDDGMADYNDDNADGEGGTDGTGGEEETVLTGPWNDADNDGIPDHLDLSDGTGTGTDIAGSGDGDGDGLSDSEECPNGYLCPDSDGDGIPDYNDTDSDNDGLTDASECPTGFPCADTDADNIPNYIDTNGCGAVMYASVGMTSIGTVSCESNGWTYYANPSNPAELLFAIEHQPAGGNTNPFTASVEITVSDNPTEASGVFSAVDTLAQEANFNMGRYWNVNLLTGSLNGAVNIRFYYDPAELLAVQAASQGFANISSPALNLSDPIWYKLDGVNFHPDAMTSTTIEGATIIEFGALTPKMETSVNYVEMEGVTSFSGGGLAFRASSGAPSLPVELTSFSGKAIDCDVQLDWTTATEDNFSHYEVEWSANGREFTTVKKIDGDGFSSTMRHYQFTDEAVSNVNYYRLKIIDLDESYEYSKVINIETRCEDHEIVVYPNPVRKSEGVLNIDFYGLESEVQFEISDMLGRVVRRMSLGTSSREVNTARLNIHDLPSGSYMINVLGNKSSRKFIIQK